MTRVESQQPYLSVVVAARNDDFGSSAAQIQAFVNVFEQQCARRFLDAEVIIVEWNPAVDRPRLASLVRIPRPAFCTYRFIEVPYEQHRTLRYADCLPLFEMIARNVGIRRARGQFVLATSLEVIFSNEIIDCIATKELKSGVMYRADRRDIQPGFPIDASLSVQMAFCGKHQVRVHGRNGSYDVDDLGWPAIDRSDMVECPLERWTSAYFPSGVTVDSSKDGIAVSTDARRFSYAVEYGPLRTRCQGAHKFELTYTLREGGIDLGVLSGDRTKWMSCSSTTHDAEGAGRHRLEIVVQLNADAEFWLVVSNNHPEGDGVSRFVIDGFWQSKEPASTAEPALRNGDGSDVLAVPARRRRRPRWLESICDRIIDTLVAASPDSLRRRIVQDAPELRATERALSQSNERLRELEPLRTLSGFTRVFHENRPGDLHVNHCGDFQLMAREHWHQLRGYPELELSSTNVDALLSYVGHEAGIEEHVLDGVVYCIEDRRVASLAPENVPCLDATSLRIWATYLHWLGHTIFVNAETWGFSTLVFPERTIERNRIPETGTGVATCSHPIFRAFNGYHGWAEPGFERGFYGVNVRDWLYTGSSKGFVERRAVEIGHPPVDEEYFEWIALLVAVASASGRFCFAEIGAGWGRWMTAAAALSRQRRLDFSLIGVEPEPSHFEWMKMVLTDNEIDPAAHSLIPAAVGVAEDDLILIGSHTPSTDYGHRAIGRQELAVWSDVSAFVCRPVSGLSLRKILANHDSVDLVDMDIQGAEGEVIAASMDTLDMKVRMLHVGTHATAAEVLAANALRAHGWLGAFSFPCQSEIETPYGRVVFGDGAQTWVNPRWPELHQKLTRGISC